MLLKISFVILRKDREKMFHKILSFFKSFSFFKGCNKATAVLLPLAVGHFTNTLDIFFPIGLSVIGIAPSDIPGNQKHLFGGIFVATLLMSFSCLMINLTVDNLYLLLPTMLVLTFFNAYISLYGHRATMVSFAGLFGIATTFAHLQTGIHILYYSLLICCGGLWYAILLYIYTRIRPRLYSEQLLGKCFELTAQFFAIRADLLTNEDRQTKITQLINLQTQLNENYEKLREAVLDSRSKSGKTDYLQRQFLMFIELVDIFELALANPVHYEHIDALFKDKKQYLEVYQRFLQELASQMKQMAAYIGSRKSIKLTNSLKSLLIEAKEKNDSLKESAETDREKEQLLALRNFYIYIEKQYTLVENIRTIFENYYSSDMGQRDESTYRKFVSEQNYSLRRLGDHISLQSTFFRHALRLSIVVTIGYLIGLHYSLENAYWILLTIFIIMRPGFGITQSRSLSRVYGTILGGAASFAVIYFVPYPPLYMYIAVLAMPIAFGLLQENYMYASIFITISAVFMFALINPDVYSVIYARLVDTIIAVGLSVGANYLLLPTWEHTTYQGAVVRSIKANMGYLQQVKEIFNTGEGITTAYKVSRKEAVLALSNLNTTFQRMLQEPKFMQNKNPSVYGIIVLQQSFLASVASLGVRISAKKSTFPKKVFNDAIDTLIEMLQQSLSVFIQESTDTSSSDSAISEFNEAIQAIISVPPLPDEVSNISKRETQLYFEQFNYLFGLAKNLNQSVKSVFSRQNEV